MIGNSFTIAWLLFYSPLRSLFTNFPLNAYECHETAFTVEGTLLNVELCKYLFLCCYVFASAIAWIKNLCVWERRYESIWYSKSRHFETYGNRHDNFINVISGFHYSYTMPTYTQSNIFFISSVCLVTKKLFLLTVKYLLMWNNYRNKLVFGSDRLLNNKFMGDKDSSLYSDRLPLLLKEFRRNVWKLPSDER